MLENASGTSLGTAAHLRVQELVRQLPDDIQPEELKTLLAPLLCKSPEEQEQFYEMFRKSWARVQETGELAAAEVEQVEEAIQQEKQKMRWGGAVVGVLFLTVVAAFAWWRQPDSGNNPLSNSERDTLTVNVLDTISTPLPVVEEKSERPDTTLYAPRDIPHPRDLTQLAPPQPTAIQRFLLAWEWPIKLALILLSGLLLWWLARRMEAKRRRLIAEHRPNVRPPYTWNLSMGTEPEVAFGEDFYNLLLQLRRRESDELWRLDVPRTIRATVDRGGLPQFKYAQQTRPAEYLLLIDRQSHRDHQARFFDLLYRAFRAQEVLVERYWYNEGDPRRCYNEAHPQGLNLRDLHYLHPQSRLLLLGNAYALLHPGTNHPTKWAVQTFSAWTDRAVLSTQPLSSFGRRERNLQDLFHVLPASLSGLRGAIELFDADEGKAPDLNPHRFPDAAQEPIELMDNDLMKTLERYFGAIPSPMGAGAGMGLSEPEAGLLWLAACALYPELHWDLTLQLGQLLDSISPRAAQSNQSPQSLQSTRLQLLCRFPWFIEGEMTLPVRQTLLAWLEREYPETHYRLREGLHRLLSQNPPPIGSAAYDDFAMNLALNEWLYARDRNRKKELQRNIAARLAAGQPADFMVLRMLHPDQPLAPEQFEVPDDWKKHLREKGFAFLNPRRAWWWVVPMWLVLSGLALWWRQERMECKGESVIFQDKEYCIENEQERAVFREMLMMNALEKGDMERADSLARLYLPVPWGLYPKASGD